MRRFTLQTDHSPETQDWRSSVSLLRDRARDVSARALKGTVARVRRGDRLSIILIVLGLVAVALIGRWFAAAGAIKNAQHGRPPAAVNVARVELADMPVTVSAIGTVTPTDTATVRAQLAGNIVAILFREGQQVRAGQVIAQVDPRPFQLAIQQSEGNLARDTALLNAARIDLARYQTLLAQDSIARQQVDTQAATVKQLEGTVGADRALLGSARLNLNFSAVKSPLTGQIGLRQVSVGSYVTPGDANGIAVVTRTDPIDVEFALPQAQLATIRASAAAAGGLPVQALDQDNQTVLAKGSFSTFDNQIDTTTGTIKAKARFANPGANSEGRGAAQALFPNQFVNVSMLVQVLHQVAVVPVSAVRHGAPGDFVFVLKPDKTVKLVVVKTGPSDGTRIAILSGLSRGQIVVSEGADGLDDGSTVRPPRGGSGGNGPGGGGGSGDAGAQDSGTAHSHAGNAAQPSNQPAPGQPATDPAAPAGAHHHHHPAASE